MLAMVTGSNGDPVFLFDVATRSNRDRLLFLDVIMRVKRALHPVVAGLALTASPGLSGYGVFGRIEIERDDDHATDVGDVARGRALDPTLERFFLALVATSTGLESDPLHASWKGLFEHAAIVLCIFGSAWVSKEQRKAGDSRSRILVGS